MATARERELQLQAQARAKAQRQGSGNSALAAGTAFGGFTPYVPPPIPGGYYDPNLDAQRQSASRGLLNTEQDVGLAGRRATEDYGFGQEDINRTFDRGTQDIGTQRAYTNEDYTRNVAMLTRQYGQQARQQGEQARKYGVTSGGIALLSAAKRAENQGIDQTALDTDRNRALAGYATADTRLGEDKTTGLGRLQVGYDRGVADRGTTLSRARSEDLFFGLDTDAQKQFQSQQAGYQAPLGPSNQFLDPAAGAVRTMSLNGIKYVVDQNGKIVRRAA